MLDVLIALVPALVWGVFQFGWRALSVTVLSVLSCVLFEALFQKICRRDVTIADLSAAVTGVLFAFTLPVGVSYVLVVLGAFFAMVIVKGLFGGLGKNIVNPALAARIFLFISFPGQMTEFTPAGVRLPVFGAFPPDAVTSATPLASLKSGLLPTETVPNLLFGANAGCIGEVSALLLLAGGLYLVVRRVIDPTLPLSCLAAVALIAYFFPQGGAEPVDFMLSELFSGGLVLGAVFMATDYVTSPATRTGRAIYGALIGLISMFIRYFGGYPEGVSFAILIMNLFVYYLDRYTRPKPFGTGGKSHDKEKTV